MDSASNYKYLPLDPHLDTPVLDTPDIIESREIGEDFPPALIQAARHFVIRQLPRPISTPDASYPGLSSVEAHPTSFVDNTPSYPTGLMCQARLRIIPWCFRSVNIPRIYTQSGPPDYGSIWTNWIGAVIEKEMRSMTASGVIVKSYIVRALRIEDSKWIRLRVIPSYGELRIWDHGLWQNPLQEPSTVPYHVKEFLPNTVWVAIMTDIVSIITGEIQWSMYIWYRVALVHSDYKTKRKLLATVRGGPYDDFNKESYLAIIIHGDVPLLVANPTTRDALLELGAVIWDHADSMNNLKNMSSCTVVGERRAEEAITICCEPPAPNGDHRKYPQATATYVNAKHGF